MTNNSAWLKRKRALRHAYQMIDYCRKNKSDKELYSIFVQLLKHYNETIDIHSLTTILQKSNVAHDLIDEWNIFFERITYAAYAQSDSNNTDELCRMAKRWLGRLEKKI